MDPLKANAEILRREMQWLARVIETRMNLYWSKPSGVSAITEISPPSLEDDGSVFASIVKHYKMSFAERIILALALAPHIQPHLLDVFFIKNSDYDRGFTEFGGIKGQNHGGFIPTGETASFILSDSDLIKRFELLRIFDEDHFFRKFKILDLIHGQAQEPFLSGVLSLSGEYLSYFTSGVSAKPDYGINFPAKRISTSLDWADLVLDENIMEEVDEIRDWIEHGDTLINDWGMSKKIKPGFRTLFYGPPGT
ncbi:MAG TPA: ATP-binding protein, partial [Daejeonella sp.]